jgi:restriction system protein
MAEFTVQFLCCAPHWLDRMANFEEAFKFVMSQPPIYFAGRQRELTTLKSVLVAGNFRTAMILGQAGIGKSALVAEFIAQTPGFFVGGVHRLPQLSSELLNEERVSHILKWGNRDLHAGPSLLVIEDCEHYEVGLLKKLITDVRRTRPDLRILAASRSRLDGFDSELVLGPLSADEMRDIWQSNLLRLDDAEYQKLYNRVGGSPLIGTLAGRLVRDERASVNDVDAYVQSFSAPGLVGPDGRPIGQDTPEERQLISGVVMVTDDLLDRIDAKPDEMHSLTSRQFEELVAGLFERQGYEVTLTPASKDGGKDIYVAKRDTVGALMYLVECKRFAPDRPVGVGLIRQLYGVVEQENATGGILAATSFFTKGAKEFTEKLRYRLSLKDYIDLQKWIKQLRTRR